MFFLLGRNIYALAIVSFGIISLAYGNIVFGLEPIPATFPGRSVIAYFTGILLLLSGLAMLFNNRAQLGATIVSLLTALWLLLLHAPILARNPMSGGAWTVATETLALSAIAWVLVAEIARRDNVHAWSEATVNKISNVGRIAFAITLPGFGALHFVYAQLVAGIVPAWFPARLFLTYFIGVAFIAAGISIATRIQMTLAATLLGLMFAIWVLVLHVPLTIAAKDQNNWTSLVIAVAMCGGSWVIASLERKRVE